MNDKIISGIVWGFRVFVGLLFIISGLIKCNDVYGFAYKLEDYFRVFEAHFGLKAAPFHAVKELMAGTIAVVEVWLAFMLLLAIRVRLTMVILLAMIIFFTFLTGYSAITNAVTDCGCFGDALKLTPWQSFSKDIVLLIMIGFMYKYHAFIKPFWSSNKNLGTFAISSVMVLGFTLYTWFYLPVVDFLPACVGCNLAKNAQADEKGEYKLAGYELFSESCPEDEFKGLALIVTMKDLELFSEHDLQHIATLTSSLKGTPIKIFGGTSTQEELRKPIIDKYKLNFCIIPQDNTMLKTVVRTTPGFLLLKDGIVIGKWGKYHGLTKEDVLKKAGL